MSMTFNRKLPIPKEVKEMYPLTEEIKTVKAARDKQIEDVFTGKSDKFLLIIGPCSADNEDSVMDYINRLAKVQEQVKDTDLFATLAVGYLGIFYSENNGSRLMDRMFEYSKRIYKIPKFVCYCPLCTLILL